MLNFSKLKIDVTENFVLSFPSLPGEKGERRERERVKVR